MHHRPDVRRFRKLGHREREIAPRHAAVRLPETRELKDQIAVPVGVESTEHFALTGGPKNTSIALAKALQGDGVEPQASGFGHTPGFSFGARTILLGHEGHR